MGMRSMIATMTTKVTATTAMAMAKAMTDMLIPIMIGMKCEGGIRSIMIICRQGLRSVIGCRSDWSGNCRCEARYLRGCERRWCIARKTWSDGCHLRRPTVSMW